MIQLKELTLGYGQRILLDKVSARITGGQLVALLGRNGTGKSTLLRAIMGLEKPQTGEIVLQRKEYRFTETGKAGPEYQLCNN